MAAPQLTWPLTDYHTVAADGGFAAPRSYAPRHAAIDFPCPEGTPVLAAAAGTVARAVTNDPQAGNFIDLDHPDGWRTRYLHLSAIYVTRGQPITQGEHIADSGNTGLTTGPHLHFALWTQNEADAQTLHPNPYYVGWANMWAIDPLPLLTTPTPQPPTTTPAAPPPPPDRANVTAAIAQAADHLRAAIELLDQALR